jgi:polysaccharide biosynthesis transport protein
MSNKQPVEQHAGLNVGDIYYVLFRQKWIILSFCTLGLLAAGALYIMKPALYQSDARLYVQYITSVRNPAQNGSEPSIQTTDPNGGNILNTELQFLTSQDLAQQVVTNLGAAKILAAYGVGPDTNSAVAMVMKYLILDDTPKTPSIIHIAYQHPDAEVARDILHEIILAYINKSADMHRPVQVSPESLALAIGQMHEKIAETERHLREAKQDAGIISSLEDTRKGLNDEFQRVKAEILAAETLLSENGAVVQEVLKTNAVTTEVTTNTPPEIPSEAVAEYNATRAALDTKRNELVNATLKYPPGSIFIKDITNFIATLTARKVTLESQYPGLPTAGTTVMTQVVGQNPVAASLSDGQSEIGRQKAKIEFLKKHLVEMKDAQARLDSLEPNIMELERTKEVQMSQHSQLLANYEHIMASTTQNNSGGIKIDEWPTPAVKQHAKSFKKMLMIALAGPIAFGLLLAFAIEMVLDRSIRRPGDIEHKLHLPLFITIPEISNNGNGNGHGRKLALPAHNRKLLQAANDGAIAPPANGTNGDAETAAVAPWDHRNGLHRFYAGLRDRLIVNFEVRNLNHNPKLVAVTSCGRGAGVSSIAAGLAASMSETGDGNVLLVNMRGEQGAALQFCNGKPACGLDDVLASETKENAFVHQNLYVASEGGHGDNLPRILPKRFASLMPKLKASDFDYIIFDMPPVSQTSVTPRLAGLMDMVLLVIESEKTNRDSIQRATALLAESKANVSTVLNKVKTYVPTRLHQEFLDDEA